MKFFTLSSIIFLLVLSFTNSIHSFSDEPLISFALHGEEETCPYTVAVTTSCLSPDWSRDEITIALGDNNGNKVVAPRFDKTLSEAGGFETCSSDTFQVKGQCLSTICSIYIYRSGPDGWIPESVEVYKEGSKSVKFDFDKKFVPGNIWYGQNHCNNNNTDLPPPFPDFPPFPPSVPPPQQPYFPPETPSIPPPSPPSPPPPPSAACGRVGSKYTVVGFAAIVMVFAAMVV